jgi:hypothetical protein
MLFPMKSPARSASLSQWKNESYLDILFDPILDSRNKNYKFTIFPTDKVVEAPISIRLSEPSFHTEDETVVYGRETDRSVVFELIFRPCGQSG